MEMTDVVLSCNGCLVALQNAVRWRPKCRILRDKMPSFAM